MILNLCLYICDQISILTLGTEADFSIPGAKVVGDKADEVADIGEAWEHAPIPA